MAKYLTLILFMTTSFVMSNAYASKELAMIYYNPSFDLDDVIKDGASKENLAPFTHLFPKTCQVALAQVAQ